MKKISLCISLVSIKPKDLLKTNKTMVKVKKFLKDDRDPNFKIND